MTRKTLVLLVLLFLLVSPSPSTAVDMKITDLTQLLVPDQYDMMVIVDDPSGTPVTKKVTVRGILNLAVYNTAYGEVWNGVTQIAPSMNAVYDKIETIAAGSGDVYSVGPGCPSGDCLTDGTVTSGTTMFVWEGTTPDSNEITFVLPTDDPTSDIVYTYPPGTGTFARTSDNVASATVATALAANPANCVDGQAALGIDASGAGECVSLGASALATEDFGAFTCTGSAAGCSLDAITAPAGSTWNVVDSVTALSVYTGTTSLEETTSATDSGAYIVGVYDEFSNSNSTTVQGVLNDLDAAMLVAGTAIGGLIFGDSSPDSAGEFGYDGVLKFYDATGLRTVLSDATAVTVAQGGTGRATGTTAYSLVATGTTATGAQQTLGNGGTTQILVGGGASALPAWGADIPTAVTIGTAYIYRAGGTDVPDADVADNITISGTGTVDPDALSGDTVDDNLIDSSILDADLATLAALSLGATGLDLLEAANAAAVKALLGYMTDLVDDTTPTLGGDLDMGAYGTYGAFTTLTVNSATPSVAVGVNFLTANTLATAITDFTNTITGKPFRVIINDALTTVKFTEAGLRGHGEVDLATPPAGTKLSCIDNGATIDCDVSEWTSLSLSTFIFPQGTTPAQTAEGSIYWDTDDNEMTIGDAATRQVFVPTGTKTDEMACAYETTGNKIDCDGSVGALTSTGTITSSGTYDATGAVAMTFGSADITSMTFTTDGTGNAEFTFPADVIGEADIDWGAGAGQVSCADIGTTDCGVVTSSGTITSSGTYDVTGANPMTLGSADVTAFTLSGASETLVITPTTDQFTVTTGTGATTLYFSGINVSTSGDLKGNIASYDDADGDTQLTAANCNGQVIYNTTKANAYVLPPAASGLNICFYATSAHAITITPYAAGNDHIWYGASDCGEDDDLVGPATIGSFVCLHARDAVNWMTWGSANTWVCE